MLRNTRLAVSTMPQILKASPSKLVIAMGLVGAQALAPAQAQDGDMRLEEIIVTSQKIAENLQDVPISVATVTGDKLADAGIENLEDLTAYLPNIHFTESGFSTQVRVRGIGSDNSQGFEQSVGMYVDGIYYGRAQLFRTPMMDMQRAELLRGPQSTLFGKNSVAGALNLTTARPTEEFEGKVSLSHEFENNQDELNAVVSGPLTETLRARLAVRSYEEDGYYQNTFTGLDESVSQEQAARLTLEWTPTDSLQFILKGERNEFETYGRSIEITLDEPLVPGNATFAEWLPIVGAIEPGQLEADFDYQRQTDLPENSDTSITNLTFTTNYDFDNNFSLTLVTGHLAFDYAELCDCDFTSATILELGLFEDYEQFSQEIRIQSPLGERFEWTAGIFYQDYDQVFQDRLTLRDDGIPGRSPTDNILPALLGLPALTGTGAARDFEQSSEAFAVFARAKFAVTPDFNIIIGARYTDESKDASKRLFIYDANTEEELVSTNPATNVTAAGLSYEGAFRFESEQSPGGHNLSSKRPETFADPLIIFEYHFNDDLMGYASYTTGSKAGGFDPRSNNRASFEFEDEESVAMEIGTKSTLLDGRLELNAALYRTVYENLQISQFDGAVGFNVGNAKETVVQGLELDGRYLITEGLTMSYGMSYLDFEYTDFENGNCSAPEEIAIRQADPSIAPSTVVRCDYTGRRGVYTPEYTLNLSFDYLRAITDNLNFVGFVDIQQVDSHNVHVNLDPAGEIDAYTMLNVRLGVEAEQWSVAVLGKNLLDEEVISYSANAPLSSSPPFQTNTFYSFTRRPMTVALEGTYRF